MDAHPPLPPIVRNSLFAQDMRHFIGRTRGLPCDSRRGPITQSSLTGPEIILKLHVDNITTLRGKDLDKYSQSPKSDTPGWDNRIPSTYVVDMKRQFIRSKIKRCRDRLERHRKGECCADDCLDCKKLLSNIEELQKSEHSLPSTQDWVDRHYLQNDLQDRQQQSQEIKRQRALQESRKQIEAIHRKQSLEFLRDKHRVERQGLVRQFAREKAEIIRNIHQLRNDSTSHSNPQILDDLTNYELELSAKKIDGGSRKTKLKRRQRKELKKFAAHTYLVAQRESQKQGRGKRKITSEDIDDQSIKEAVKKEDSLLFVGPFKKFDIYKSKWKRMKQKALSRRRVYSRAFHQIYLSALPLKESENHHENVFEARSSEEEDSSSYFSSDEESSYSSEESSYSSDEDTIVSPQKKEADNPISHHQSPNLADQSFHYFTIVGNTVTEQREESMEDETLMVQPTDDSQQASVSQNSVADEDIYEGFDSASSTDDQLLTPPVTFSCIWCQDGNKQIGDFECLCEFLFN